MYDVEGSYPKIGSGWEGTEAWKLVGGRWVGPVGKKGFVPCERWTVHSSTSLLSTTNNDLAPLSADEFALPGHEKALQGRDGGGWTLLEFVRFIYHEIFSAAKPWNRNWKGEGERKGVRKSPRWYGRKLYCIYCEMKFLEATILSVLWQLSNPRRRTFVATKTFLASSIRDNEPHPFSLWNTSSISLAPLSWPSSLGTPFRPRPTLLLIHEYCMTIVEIFIVRSRSEEENRLSEQAVVSNELVGRKLSFARSNLLGPWLNRRLPAGSGLRYSLSPSFPPLLSLPLSLSLSFWLFSFSRLFFSAVFSPFSHLCLDGGARGLYERSWGASYFYWFSRNVGVENISTTYARWTVYSWSVN